MTIRILLVDANILFRKGVAALLSQHNDFHVVGDLGCGKEATQKAVSLAMDMVLIDVMLAGTNGLDCAVEIKRRAPQVRAIIFTHSRDEEHLVVALRSGIEGYVLKDASVEELMLAIRSVASGKRYLSQEISAKVLANLLHPAAAKSNVPHLESLTRRERGILQLIAEGKTNRGAAEFLNVSPKTVEKHRAILKHKLGLHKPIDILLAAVEMGLVERPASLSRVMRDGAAGAWHA